jgi:hypothetical protein
MHSDPGKEIGRSFFIDPSVDFDFVGPAQLPDLGFEVFDIHNGLLNFRVGFTRWWI